MYMVYASSGHMKCFECGDVDINTSHVPINSQQLLLLLLLLGSSWLLAVPAAATPTATTPVETVGKNESEGVFSFGTDAGDAIPVNVP
ncbi:hypothetical protein D4764_14G0005430 [Takifugu flavidus]|uniref:Uncharacterized protein n=1 Tax=Takifugu flavidus TaxID=433684 RepID=A0A5C6P8I4_9TELE|nr:hypothetical protein D4764_14G0005430 [Takifugu flavidus]